MSTPPINILNLNDESPEYSDESEELLESESEESEEIESEESSEELRSTISVSELSESEPSDEPDQPKRPATKPKKNNIAEAVLTMRSRVKHITPESSESSEEKPKKASGRKPGKFTKPKYALETVVGYKGKERVLKLVGKYATIQEIADHLQITYSKAYRIWRGHDVLSKKIVISKLEEKISRY